MVLRPVGGFLYVYLALVFDRLRTTHALHRALASLCLAVRLHVRVYRLLRLQVEADVVRCPVLLHVRHLVP